MIKSKKLSSTLNKIFVSSAILIITNNAIAQEKKLGLYNEEEFLQTTGTCENCGPTKQSLWYFEKEIISVPKNKDLIAGFSGTDRQKDLVNYIKNKNAKPDNSLPSIVWTGSHQIIEGTLNKEANKIKLSDGREINFRIVPKISTNLSYYNERSVNYFSNKQVVVRGEMQTMNGEQQFVARTIWRKDFNLNPTLKVDNQQIVKTAQLVKDTNMSSEMSYQTLWTKNNQAVDIRNKPVIAFILNGAQGDDDEAHGGHFAVATGFVGSHGEWNNWLVNNFYGLNSFSEKGITASILPMDAYQADLNSGQSWYRPSYMLVAILKDKRVPQLYQESINRVFNHFYRHDFEYNHALANCAGINMETLRTLGWSIPEVGSENTMKAAAALPFISIKDHSITNGKKAFDYLSAEMTNLYPAMAFSEIGDDLLNRITKTTKSSSQIDNMLEEDIEAIVYIKLPQFPSSRATGLAPIFSLDEYMKRVPEDKKDWKIIPVEPRVFPQNLKDPNAKTFILYPSDYALLIETLIVLLIIYGSYRVIKNRRSKK